MMLKERRIWWFVFGAIILFFIALNFLSFRAARSKTEMNHSLSTYRTGETLPDSMMPEFTLSYFISNEGRLAKALAPVLQTELEEKTSVDTAAEISNIPQEKQSPILLLNLESDRSWIPVYCRATMEAQIYYAYDGDVPWPLDEPVEFRISPAVKADGVFTLEDTTWGLISKPAYNKHLAQELAEAIAVAMQNNVFN